VPRTKKKGHDHDDNFEVEKDEERGKSFSARQHLDKLVYASPLSILLPTIVL
jgi:hypothetical protein